MGKAIKAYNQNPTLFGKAAGGGLLVVMIGL